MGNSFFEFGDKYNINSLYPTDWRSKDKEITYREKLQNLLLSNKISEFIYSNVSHLTEDYYSTIRVYGKIVNKKLQVSFSPGSDISPQEITGINLLNGSDRYLSVKTEKGWELFDKNIDKMFASSSVSQIQAYPSENEIKQIYYEFLEAGFVDNNRSPENKKAEFSSICNKVNKQLANKFYSNIQMFVYIKRLDEFGKVIEGQENTLKTRYDDTPYEVKLNVTIKADGTAEIKHVLSNKYLEEYVKYWEKEKEARGIDVNINDLRKQVIQDFESLEIEKTFYQKFIQSAKSILSDNIAGYVEGVQATQKIAKNVWEFGTINKSTWYSKDEKEYKQWPSYVHFEPVIGGATDAVIDEIVGMPVAIKGVYQIVTDDKKRQAVSGMFTKKGMGELYKGLKEEVKSTLDDEERRDHFTGQATVTVVLMFTGYKILTETGELAKILDKATDGLNELVNPKVLTILKELKDSYKYGPKIRKAIEDFLKGFDPKILDKLVDAPGFKKVIEDMSQNWKKFKGGKFVLEYASKAVANGKIIRFEVNNLSDDIRRIYDIEIEVAKGVLKKLELKNWSEFYPDTIKNQFVKDLQKMKELGEIQWVFNKAGVNSELAGLKDNVIKALKKQDGTPIDELDDITEAQVKKLFPSDISNITSNNFKEKLLENLNKEEEFSKIFKIVE